MHPKLVSTRYSSQPRSTHSCCKSRKCRSIAAARLFTAIPLSGGEAFDICGSVPLVGLGAYRIGIVGDTAARVARFCSSGLRSLTEMRVFSTNIGATMFAAKRTLSPSWLLAFVLVTGALLFAAPSRPVPEANTAAEVRGAAALAVKLGDASDATGMTMR